MMKKSEVAVCGLSLAALLFFVNPPALAQSALLQINAGGPAVSPFVADEDFSGGATIDHANTINTSKVTNPAPAAVYQTARVAATTAGPGPTYTYTIGGFTAGTSYLVRLHFCETYFSTAGSRVFDVSINGTQVLTNFDIEKTAGGQNIANIQQFTEPANSSGQFVILFTSVTNNALISGIEIDSTASCSTPTVPSGLTATAASSSQINLSWTSSSSSCAVTYNIFRSTTSGFTPSTSNQIATGVTTTTYSNTGLTASTTYYYLVEGTNAGGTSAASNQASATTQSSGGTQLIAINSGGPAVAPFVADEDFSGGSTIDHANTINTSNVTNPAPAAVYQSGRDTSTTGAGGTFSYTIGGFTAGTNYLVRLHFCETYWTAAGKRTFNVSINGTQVLTNFDIFATAGGQNIANIQQFIVAANSSGQFVIVFTTVVNNALVSGIEIDTTSGAPPPDFSISASPSSQTVTAGSQTIYTVTVGTVNGFTGSVALTASGLPSGATASFNPASISVSGTSTLTVSTSTSTPAATSTLTITGTSGSLVHSTTVSLTVTTSSSNNQRATQIVNEMTLTEDTTELHGIQDANDYRVVPGISSLGIPLLNIANGPAGAASGGPGHEGNATAMSAPISLAATWDVNLANQYGTVVGAEAKDWANGLVEGPDINIARTLQGGRTFEGYGEDPYLAGQIAVADIEGIQSNGIIAESKHFDANNQETNRGSINEIIDQRTLREIYLPQFEATVKQANVGAVMCAYNLVNGAHMCENGPLLNTILKQEWGFQGFTTSDFGATNSTVNSANNGLDLEMPTGVYFASALATAVQNGQVTQATVNDKLIRRFTTMLNFGVFNNPPGVTTIPSAADGLISRQISEAGMVLLQNNGAILPLKASSLHTIAVIGPYAGSAKTGGGGSSQVSPIYTVSPVTGIQNVVGSGVTVSYNNGSTISTAVTLAQSSDVAIVMVGDSEAEGSDGSISLSGTQDSLVEQIVAAQPKTIVVMKSGTGILMPWASSVPAILQAWYPGEEDGNAVAAVLFGSVNPSGKLPLTIPVSASDPDPPADGSQPAQYPGVNGTVTYSEGVFVGYRHYDQAGITPLFPFGFGLSYTTFSFSNLSVTPTTLPDFSTNPNQTVTVSFNVKNTGSVTGAEVAQVYVAIPSPSSSVLEPPKWLKGFQKISLTPGQTSPVTITLNMRSFAYWDVTSSSWLVAPGTYQIMVGDSSRNIVLQAPVTIN
ncbi:MAG: glycoside hydrolase family 3 C-terminal domain-containing protein [Candidatus Acidiferrales bacterium]